MENVEHTGKKILKITTLAAYLAVFVILRFIPLIRGAGYLWLECLTYIIIGTLAVFAYRPSFITGFREWKTHPVKNLLWLAGTFIASILLESLASIPFAILFPTYESGQEDAITFAFTETSIPAVILVLALGLAGPLLEEAVFRCNMVADAPARIPSWITISFSSLLFMTMHMNSLSLPELCKSLPMFACGLCYGIALHKTKNASIPAALHVFNNLPTLIMIALSMK